LAESRRSLPRKLMPVSDRFTPETGHSAKLVLKGRL
jgi:hypothetical protein